ncbi:hypothetical protein AACH06_09545 [Ideonella sp. DXS29W]|uniref:Uncharacterized protein n=1 Tax=Ideonella lacteola TaxID=2984193 RepID=A0ABU9BM78_9BURK
MNVRHALAAAALAAVSVTSFAQSTPAPVAPPATPTTPPVTEPGVRGTNTPVINKHEANQQDRIRDGKQSGEITKREARRLHAEQKAVDRAQNKAAADGTVTTQERHHIRRMQARADKDIYRQKHDGAQRPDKPTTPATPATPSAVK